MNKAENSFIMFEEFGTLPKMEEVLARLPEYEIQKSILEEKKRSEVWEMLGV